MIQKLLLILFCFSLAQYAWAEKVMKVYDGDTFTLESGVRVRLDGIDAPEIGQPFGKDSRNYLQRLVKDRDVHLECSGKSFDRKVCWGFVVGLDLQKELVGWGLAYDSPKYSKGRYANAEAFARTQKRGVWALPEGSVRPWDYRSNQR